MATAAIQSLKVIKPTPTQPLNVSCCHDRNTGITRTLSAVLPLEPPIPIPDARGSLTNDELRKIAAGNQPPQEWFDREEEQLF